MGLPLNDVVAKWALGALLVSTLGGILVAGLWPFHAPLNQVTWLENGNGIRFGDNSTILSSGQLNMNLLPGEDACSLEILMEPSSIEETNTFLAFYSPGSPIQFAMHQYLDDLGLVRKVAPQQPVTILIPNVFHLNQPVFITITSNNRQSVYINGVPTGSTSALHLSRQDLSGQLVVANSPRQNESWGGRLRGIAVYHQSLTAAQIVKHYDNWMKEGKPALSGDEGSSALFTFDEHKGNVVHNKVAPEFNLYIPRRYTLLDPIVLNRPWNEFGLFWGYWKNVLINIAGFVPLGFFCYVYLLLALKIRRRALLISTVFGTVVSLTIEILQAFLPTRDSGMTDLFTNTLGTYLGALLCQNRFVQDVFTKVLDTFSGAFAALTSRMSADQT